MQNLWKKIDAAQQKVPSELCLPDDECYYAREYTSGAGFGVSLCNDLIQNFKKSPDKRGTDQWQYKENSIRRFAKELASLFTKDKQYTVCTILTSKRRGSPNYDDRFDQVIAELKGHHPSIIYEEPIELIDDSKSASREGGPRDASSIIKSYRWTGFKNGIPPLVIVLDDVITTGGHFKASKQVIHAHHPEIRVIGVFWAMTVREGFQ